MLSRICMAALLAGLAWQAPGQTAASPAPGAVPDRVVYEAFFRRVVHMDGVAKRSEAQGVSTAWNGFRLQAAVKLTPAESTALRAIAADCGNQILAKYQTAQPLIAAARSQAAASGSPSAETMQQLQNLENQRRQIVAGHVQQLANAFGQTRFAQLDAYIRGTSTVKAIPAQQPKQP